MLDAFDRSLESSAASLAPIAGSNLPSRPLRYLGQSVQPLQGRALVLSANATSSSEADEVQLVINVLT